MQRRHSTAWPKHTLTWLTCSVATTLIGCASPPTLPDFPAEPPAIEATQPLPSCAWPELAEGVLATGDTVYYLRDGAAGLSQQDACRETEQANHDIARANATALMHLDAAYDELLLEGQAQRDRALYHLEDTESRRRDTMIELWAYKGLLALAAIAAIL